MEFLIVTLLTIAIVPCVSQDGPNCDKLVRVADDCMRDLMLVGQKAAPVPTTKRQLATYCSGVRNKTMPCMRQFINTCMAPFPRTMFNVGFKLLLKQFKRYCFTPEGQTEFVSNAPCFTPEHIVVFHDNLDIVTNFVDHVAANVSTNDIIPNMCCAYFTAFDKTFREFNRICSRPEAVDFFVGLVKTVASDFLDMGCGRYSSPQSCYAHLPEAMAIFDRIAKPGNLKRSPGYSPMVPLVKIMQRLDLPD
ncbi:hypothetical protein HDE_01242 [Halotydeus destructor]|nr:hypothetical protein HDE_01242 [Halotydeus destructor]